MTEREIVELAAILVQEHGAAAVRHAQERRAQQAREPNSDVFRLWGAIAEAASRLLANRARKNRARKHRALEHHARQGRRN